MKKESKSTQISLNINKDDSTLNDFIYCWERFDSRPNKTTIHNNYSTDQFTKVINELTISRNTFTELIPAEDEMIVNDKILAQISENIFISYVIVDKNVDSSIISDVSFFYKEEESINFINDLIDKIELCTLDYSEEETHNLNIMSLYGSGLEIEPIIKNKIDLENIELYYSNKTFKSIGKLIKKIKKSDRGLSILYGPRGTGKTSVVNYISENIDRVAIFIPNNLVDQTINNPEFRKFMKKFHKPIVILDDCEMIFNEFFTKSNMIVNNLLQMIDGLVSDNITFLTIFNVEDESEIDHTLLECNNLMEVINITELSKDESNDLSTHLGFKKKFKTEMILNDILNNKKVERKSSFGF
jgi:hypothetical protein